MTDEALAEDTLSPRQLEIVELVVGQSMVYKQVALALGISEHTVRTHVEEIGRRLGGTPRKVMARYYFTVMQELEE